MDNNLKKYAEGVKLPVSHFWVKPEDDDGLGLMFEVRMYETVQEMTDAIKVREGAVHLDVGGVCTRQRKYDFSKNKEGELLPEIACIWLCKEYKGVGVISHEVFHAIAHWADCLGLLAPMLRELSDGNSTDYEERIAHAYGKTVSDIVRRLYRDGIYETAEQINKGVKK